MLGIWVSQNEGAKFWLNVLTELKNRGVEDILIACVDGLTGFPDAIQTVYPQTQVQLCIVHMVRNSLRYVGWKKKKEVAADLKSIYSASTVEEAELALSALSELNKGLRQAASKNAREHVRTFCKLRAEVNAQDEKSGKTALHWAVIKGAIECVEILLHYGASRDVRDFANKTPGDYDQEGSLQNMYRFFPGDQDGLAWVIPQDPEATDASEGTFSPSPGSGS